jgi:putative ABC transport system substrate-binding protein
MMRRRAFIALLGGAAAWPMAARGQQGRQVPRVGVLMANSRESAPQVDALKARLADYGRVDGQTVIIDVVWADGRIDRFNDLAAELVGRKPAVVVAPTTATVIAMKRIAPGLPTVFVTVADPIGSGFITSYARPGGNATGVQSNIDTLPGKQIELLRDVVPNVRRIGMLVNAPNPSTIVQKRNAQATAASLGITLLPVEIAAPEDIEHSFQQFVDQHAEGVLFPTDATTFTERKRIARLAEIARLPSIFPFREHVKDGGMLSYGVDMTESWRSCADFVHKILNGAKPSDLPVYFPTKLYLAINLKTAKALGLTVPDKLLALADEVIE